MSRSQATLTGIIIVIVGLALIVIMMVNRPKPPKKPVKTNSPLVQVIAPQFENVQFNVESHGVIQPRTETSLVSEVAGVVQSVSDTFVAGGYFKKGEVLLKIDSTDYQVALEQAKARLTSAQAKYEQEKARSEQAKKEWDLTGRSRKNAPALALREPFLLEAKANMQSAEADLKKAQQKLSRTIIRAPYDGMVKSKKIDVGQFVATGTQLGVTFAIDYAEVRLPLTDRELAFISVPQLVAQEASQTYPGVKLVATYAGKITEWQAKLVRMEGVVDQSSRVHYAVARIYDPYSVLDAEHNYPPLKMGTFITAHIEGVEAQNVMKIPRDTFRDLKKVLVSDKSNQLHMRDLEVVRAEADYVYIKSGLEKGDQVVLTSIESPVQGMKVRIEGQEEVVEKESDAEKENKVASDKTDNQMTPRQ